MDTLNLSLYDICIQDLRALLLLFAVQPPKQLPTSLLDCLQYISVVSQQLQQSRRQQLQQAAALLAAQRRKQKQDSVAATTAAERAPVKCETSQDSVATTTPAERAPGKSPDVEMKSNEEAKKDEDGDDSTAQGVQTDVKGSSV